MAMKKLAYLTLALASIVLMSNCGTTPKDAPKTAVDSAKAADDVFKYTITTDIDVEGDNVEILIAMNTVYDQYPVKYDLDCEGDGEFEYQDLTDNQRCIYKKNTGKHQIWLRGEIPAIFLCYRTGLARVDKEFGDSGLFRFSFDEMPEEIEQRWNDHSAGAVVSIDSWGNVPWKSMEHFAAYCEALETLPEGSPDLRQVTDMSSMFFRATAFNQPLEKWDVSKVTDMSDMFSSASSFNQPLEKWDVSRVTDMSGMFHDAKSFNQPLEKWDVSNVTNMKWMFYVAQSFNQPLETWDVSNVTNMESMFAYATSFDQPLEKWDVSNVTDMTDMFWGAEAFRHLPANWVIPEGDHEIEF